MPLLNDIIFECEGAKNLLSNTDSLSNNSSGKLIKKDLLVSIEA